MKPSKLLEFTGVPATETIVKQLKKEKTMAKYKKIEERKKQIDLDKRMSFKRE